MAVSRSIWQNIQQYSWLFFSIACLVAALIFWAVTDRDALVEVDHPSKNEAQVEIKSEKVTATTNLGALTNEVKPLDLTTRVVVSNEHAPEFRGTKFISENQRQWVVEIFRSSDEAIVKNFLLNRADRNKFSYFRLSGDQQVEQYVLAYGLFPNAEEAKRQFSQLNLVLPKSIHPTIQQLSTYTSYVNDLGSDELKSASNQLFEVRLKPAALPKIDETLLSGQQVKGSSNTALSQSVNTSTTVTTTVTQRDAQGNVVNVRQSQSNQQNNSSTPEKIRENSDSSRREVTDPFN
ncbi:hypothetical protein L292_3117 [Acinetobacter junii CIP 107470 = MTCC 11364]|uniref:SPOR domain-containing protein n=1 Tax=Acinetobacter junii CIP 107470 = MTCC 11364 TaxID=1217666 RepID=S7WRW0_ACIJU|nr:hypothetical protein [Acinetobacter junii]ENV51390.1 hypothetical protein F953_01144 [Acinetobacter junii CIP 107470 = MTCC 11364]EPR85916.1 hypothetical protein L292_3117 [Acinetobacter junii CIP 107470 = MTCC 11364]